MSPIEHEWQHDGCADGDHSDPMFAQGQYDPLNSVLIDTRPWPKLNGAQWFCILFGGEIALMVVAWLVTK